MKHIQQFLLRFKKAHAPALFSVAIAIFFGAIFLVLVNYEVQKRQSILDTAALNCAQILKGNAEQLQQCMHGDTDFINPPSASISETRLPNSTWQWATIRKNDSASRIILLAIGMTLLMSILIGLMAYMSLQYRAALKHHVLHDALTGLPNRRLLLDRAQYALSRAQRSGQLVAVMVIDIDYFKQYNDTFGYDFGDAVIKKSRRAVGRAFACNRYLKSAKW